MYYRFYFAKTQKRIGYFKNVFKKKVGFGNFTTIVKMERNIVSYVLRNLFILIQ